MEPKEMDQKEIKCNKCPKRFTTRQAKSRHILAFHASRPSSFDCNGCGKKFGRKDNSDRHKIKCKGSKNLVCNICQKKIDRKAKLAQHQLTHKKQMHQCEFCQRLFKRADHFKQHQSKLCQHSSAQIDVDMERFIQSEIEERESYSMAEFKEVIFCFC